MIYFSYFDRPLTVTFNLKTYLACSSTLLYYNYIYMEIPKGYINMWIALRITSTVAFDGNL